MGVILSVLDFREKNRIATIFSPEGLVKLVGQRSSLLTALTEGEFLFTEGRGDLGKLRDGTILDQHLRLRKRFESLEAAGKMAQAVLKTQWPGKEAPQLFHLFKTLLRLIPEVEQPEELTSIFLVKTMKHEGVLQLLDQCSYCERQPCKRFGGERFCQEHAPEGALELSEEEEKQLNQIAEERSSKRLTGQLKGLYKPIESLFNQVF